MPPRKIKTEPDGCFPAVDLYLNDLADIQTAITDALGDVPIVFGDGEYVYDSLDELVAQRGKGKIKNLEISTNGNTDLSVKVRVKGSIGGGNWFSVPPVDSNEGMKLYHSIRSILDQRRRWITHVFGYDRLFSLKTYIFLDLLLLIAFFLTLFWFPFLVAILMSCCCSTLFCGLSPSRFRRAGVQKFVYFFPMKRQGLSFDAIGRQSRLLQ